MSDALTRPLDPADAADRGLRLEGEFELASLRRLVEMLAAATGDVRAEMSFGRDGGRRILIEGRCSAPVRLICQRCLEPMDWELSGEFHLQVMEDQGLPLKKGCDPVELESGMLLPADLVEDELILAVPLSPAHPDAADCGATASMVQRSEDVGAEGVGETRKPFAGLAKMMEERSQDDQD